MTAGLTALRAAAQRHRIAQEHERDASKDHAHGHATKAEAESIRERLAQIVDRGSHRKEAEVAREIRPEHGRDDIRARLGRILGREAEQAEPEAGGSAHGQEARSISERLQAVLARDKQVGRESPRHERDEAVHRHKDRGTSMSCNSDVSIAGVSLNYTQLATYTHSGI